MNDFEIKQKDATNISIPTPDTDNIPVDNGTVTEPSVSQDLEDTVDTPKRKYKRKADELSDVSPDVDNTDNTSAE